MCEPGTIGRTETANAMTLTFEKIDELAVGNLLGEGIQWRSADQSIWWTDILGQKLYSCSWPGKELTIIDTPEPLGSFAFVDDGPTILAAFATGFAWFNTDTLEVTWLQRPEFLPGEGRFNDGRADRQGRFWSGTMVANPGDGRDSAGRLFCLDAQQRLMERERALHISNGLCWSPHSSQMYFADSLLGEIYRYDFDRASGAVSNKAIFAKAPEGGSPDGAGVDGSGRVWSATWGIGKILVYSPDGALVAEVSVPASQPSCIAFGGENFDLLFVTSAKDGLSNDVLGSEPSAGNVFVYQTNATGLPESQYKID